MIDSEPPGSEAEILRRCMLSLRSIIPDSWTLSSEDKSLDSADSGLDAKLTITAPDGGSAHFGIEVKATVQRRDVRALASRFRAAATTTPDTLYLVASRYLSPPVRQALVEQDVSFVDVTGNLSISSDRPPIVLRDRGSDNDPWRGRGRPRGTLKGEPAAKVVRTLIGSSSPWKVRDLVTVSRASTGATYRVLEYLQVNELVDKTEQGLYQVPDWPALLRRWSRDYSVVDNNRTYTFLEPRGIPSFLAKLPGSSSRYAVTSSVAAAQWAAYAPARSITLYVDDASTAASEWALRRTEAGANIVLAEPHYDIVFDRTSTTTDGYTVANIAQVAVDLLTGPGRNPAEGEELIEWMQANEQSWRD